MGELGAFLRLERVGFEKRDPRERVRDYRQYFSLPDDGWIVAEPPEERTGRTVGVVGSGPAGLAVAAELNKLGQMVTVYERDEAPGGLLRFGVPDAKLEKWIIDRRV